MGLFFDKILVLLAFIFGITACMFILPLACLLTVINWLVHDDWCREGWMKVKKTWKEALDDVADFLAL